ncbi:MAG: AsmA-like C-terminal region-containing protein [Saprospiraceae bacterium]
MLKKILFAFAAILVLVIGSLIAIPYFFKDEIVESIKTTANESLTAKLDFSDVSLSVFRHFPKLSVGLNELSITGTGDFEDIRLMYCKRMDLAVDLFSIFGDQVKVKGLYLDEPDIRVYVLSNGKANYDIAKADPEAEATTTTTASTESSPIKLEHYEITNGYVLYDDRPLDVRAELKGLNHSGSGEFTSDIYDLVTETSVKGLSVNYGGMQYLKNANTEWDATLNADMPNMKFTLKDNTMRVNAMELMVNGWVAMPGDDIDMDLSFGSPQNSFKSFLSLIPGAYTEDFGSVQANGSLQFAGVVKGKYTETQYPSFKLGLNVRDADFKYPDLPLGVSGINVDMLINSPTANMDDMSLDISKFALKIGSNPLSGYFKLRKPESNPTVDTEIKGTLNLDELSKAFPMDDVSQLAGVIKADVRAKASMNQIDQGAYDQVEMGGDFDISNMVYRASGMPAVRITALKSSLSPQRMNLSEFDARLGKSDLRANGSIDNLLAYFSTNKTMTGTMTFRSAYFDANEWMEEPASTEASTAPDAGKVPNDVPAEDEAVFDRWDFKMDGRIGKMVYEDYDLSNMVLVGHFMPNKMQFSEFGMKINDSDLSGNGTILNIMNYLYDNQTLTGTMNLSSNYFDLNPFMTDSETVAEDIENQAAGAPPIEEGVFPVPDNIDMTLNARFAKVLYTDMTLNNLSGAIIIRNGIASLKDFTADILGGQIALNGDYNTQDLSKPSFDMDMALINMSFKESYEQFASVKALAPIAQFIDGKFNTTLSMKGLLGQDMTPDFTTLSAEGFLETINAIVNNFKPMNEIGSKLNVSALRRLELQNSRNWFEIKDGSVAVKPFAVQAGDVNMNIGGSHGIGGDMNYQIMTKTPRKALGTAANSGISLLSKEASKYGVSLAQGEYINVRFDLTGKLANPKVAMKVLGSDGESTLKDQANETGQALVDQAKDSLRNVANQQVDQAKEKANQIADGLSRVAEQKQKKQRIRRPKTQRRGRESHR